jgi:hypothetical protein
MTDPKPERDDPLFPIVDPVEDLSEATPAPAQEPLQEVLSEVADMELSVWENAVGTARAALAEIAAMSTSPSVSTAKLGAVAQRALDALPVT